MILLRQSQVQSELTFLPAASMFFKFLTAGHSFITLSAILPRFIPVPADGRAEPVAHDAVLGWSPDYRVRVFHRFADRPYKAPTTLVYTWSANDRQTAKACKM